MIRLLMTLLAAAAIGLAQPVMAETPAYPAAATPADWQYGPEVRQGEVGYHIVTDRLTGFQFVQMTRLADPVALKRLNSLLDAERDAIIDEHDYCRREGLKQGFKDWGWSHHAVAVTFVNTAVMVVAEQGESRCGGAHGLLLNGSRNYDLRQGEPLNPNRLLDLYDQERPGTKIWSAAYADLLGKLTPSSPYALAGAKSKTADGESCFTPANKLAAGGAYSEFDVSFSAKGLVLSVDRGDAPYFFSCTADYFAIPYADIKALWRPEAKAYFPELF